jgi:asparagine synthase (glutamine-hydrolysing)
LWNAALLREFGFSPSEIQSEPAPALPDDFARISWSELSHYMRDVLLRDSDQMSMAVSLEVRVPFLDHELVEFVLGLPASEKQKPGRAKSLLIESMRDLLPPEIYQRRKMGFELPMPVWIKGPLRDFALTGLEHTVNAGVFSKEQIEHLNGLFRADRLHWTKLWAVVVLGWYLAKEKLPLRDEGPLLKTS